ncbi:MAG: Uma2 family endonuclease [Cyanobacteria bacterium J06606_4]
MTVVVAKWTLEEYHAMVESGVLDNRRVELIRGEIVEMPPEGKPHASRSASAGEYLTLLLIEKAQIRPAKPITLPNQSEPEPDIAIVRRIETEYEDHHPYPENIFWLIEYSESSLSKDLNLKSKVYAEVNIPEYWVVDLKEQTLVVFRYPEDGEYTSCVSYTDGQLTALAFPDISIAVNRIIRRK